MNSSALKFELLSLLGVEKFSFYKQDMIHTSISSAKPTSPNSMDSVWKMQDDKSAIEKSTCKKQKA
jgi:hypothetical protein